MCKGLFFHFFTDTPSKYWWDNYYTSTFFPLQSPRKKFSRLKTRQYFSTALPGFTGGKRTLTGTLILIRRNSCIYTLGSGTFFKGRMIHVSYFLVPLCFARRQTQHIIHNPAGDQKHFLDHASLCACAYICIVDEENAQFWKRMSGPNSL